jgi:HTH-type transcriptional regulator/antitoxin HigA
MKKLIAKQYKDMAEINNERQYNVLIERIEELLPLVNNETPADDRYLVELDIISNMVEEYEEKYYPVEMPTLAEIIKDEMSERGLTQKQLAELLGVSPSRISEYMTGKAEPTLKVARLLNKKLDIDADFILG